MVELARVKSVLTLAPDKWLIPVLSEMPKWGIDTLNEQCSFLAEVSWECRQFTRLVEYMNYSTPERLAAVWPSRFYVGSAPATGGKRDAGDYIHAPEKLAEYVYGGRMGNGPEGSGDGWKFRGRGPVNLTGQKNYLRAEQETGFTVHADPEQMLVPEIGAGVSCWFWKANGFDAVDDDTDLRAETRLLQGGSQDLAGRQDLMNRLLRAHA